VQNVHEPVYVLALGGDQDAAFVIVSWIVERLAVEAGPVRELAIGVGDGLLRPERVHAALACVANHRECLPNNTSLTVSETIMMHNSIRVATHLQ